jgi:hypothetical protein
MSFVTFVEPAPENIPGPDKETLGILIDRSEDGTRGSLQIIHPNGGTQVRHNVPFDGNQVAYGAYIKPSPPADLVVGAPGEPPPAESETDETTVNF